MLVQANPDTPSPIKLPAALDKGSAAELRTILVAALAGAGDIVIDGAEVTAAETASLQVLAAFAQDAAAARRTVRWAGASTALLSTAGWLGLRGHLGLDDDFEL